MPGNDLICCLDSCTWNLVLGLVLKPLNVTEVMCGMFGFKLLFITARKDIGSLIGTSRLTRLRVSLEFHAEEEFYPQMFAEPKSMNILRCEMM